MDKRYIYHDNKNGIIVAEDYDTVRVQMIQMTGVARVITAHMTFDEAFNFASGLTLAATALAEREEERAAKSK